MDKTETGNGNSSSMDEDDDCDEKMRERKQNDNDLEQNWYMLGFEDDTYETKMQELKECKYWISIVHDNDGDMPIEIFAQSLGIELDRPIVNQCISQNVKTTNDLRKIDCSRWNDILRSAYNNHSNNNLNNNNNIMNRNNSSIFTFDYVFETLKWLQDSNETQLMMNEFSLYWEYLLKKGIICHPVTDIMTWTTKTDIYSSNDNDNCNKNKSKNDINNNRDDYLNDWIKKCDYSFINGNYLPPLNISPNELRCVLQQLNCVKFNVETNIDGIFITNKNDNTANNETKEKEKENEKENENENEDKPNCFFNNVESKNYLKMIQSLLIIVKYAKEKGVSNFENGDGDCNNYNYNDAVKNDNSMNSRNSRNRSEKNEEIDMYAECVACYLATIIRLYHCKPVFLFLTPKSKINMEMNHCTFIYYSSKLNSIKILTLSHNISFEILNCVLQYGDIMTAKRQFSEYIGDIACHPFQGCFKDNVLQSWALENGPVMSFCDKMRRAGLLPNVCDP